MRPQVSPYVCVSSTEVVNTETYKFGSISRRRLVSVPSFLWDKVMSERVDPSGKYADESYVKYGGRAYSKVGYLKLNGLTVESEYKSAIGMVRQHKFSFHDRLQNRDLVAIVDANTLDFGPIMDDANIMWAILQTDIHGSISFPWSKRQVYTGRTTEFNSRKRLVSYHEHMLEGKCYVLILGTVGILLTDELEFDALVIFDYINPDLVNVKKVIYTANKYLMRAAMLYK